MGNSKLAQIMEDWRNYWQGRPQWDATVELIRALKALKDALEKEIQLSWSGAPPLP